MKWIVTPRYSASLLLVCFFPAAPLFGGDAEKQPANVDKSAYTIFNPTPREQWRELSPDRPDTTESPISVDAGAYVIEASYFDWGHDDGDDTYTVMATNFKVGLSNRIDLQTVFEAYTWEQPQAGTGLEGFGDVTLRLKYNVWGNDGGPTAFAIFPFIKIPTGTDLSNGATEGGLILPFSTDLAEGIGLGLMAEFDAVYDEADGDHDLEFLHSAVLGFDLTERLGLFAEYIGIASPAPYQAYLSGGLTLSLGEDLMLDCGAKAGLNENSDDFGAFAGFTKRF